jgi:hypothetical protein
MAQQQEDGYYPRVNANLISASQIGQIVSLVGAVDGCDGTVATIRCGVGTTKVIVEPDFSHPSGHIMEAIGCVNDDLSIQVSRETMPVVSHLLAHTRKTTEICYQPVIWHQGRPSHFQFFVSIAPTLYIIMTDVCIEGHGQWFWHGCLQRIDYEGDGQSQIRRVLFATICHHHVKLSTTGLHGLHPYWGMTQKSLGFNEVDQTSASIA